MMKSKGKRGDNEEKEKIGNTEEFEIVVLEELVFNLECLGSFGTPYPGFTGQYVLKYSTADTWQLHRLVYRIFLLLSNDLKIKLATVFKQGHSR
jgi:hypothetical protein